MLKRLGCSSVELILKRHRRSIVENLPDDVVELILERLPVESLMKLKSVCKKWNSIIDSQLFQERQLIHRRQSRCVDALFVSIMEYRSGDIGCYEDGRCRIVLGLSEFRTIKSPFLSTEVCHGGCDGLLCLSDVLTPNFVINPVTGWHRYFPHCSFQKLRLDRYNKGDSVSDVPSPKLGFGRDKLRGTYKAVWLYNSSEFGLDNVTTCEVFDFGTNAWRYVLPASPYRILSLNEPEYLDGSLYWLSECKEAKVLSLNLHTKTFQVISETPFTLVTEPVLSVLDNRLCISVENWPYRVILSLSGNKTWEKMFSIELYGTLPLFGIPISTIVPVAILDKNKLLLRSKDKEDASNHAEMLVIHDLTTNSYDLFYNPITIGYCVSYFPSLFTA